MSSQTSSAADGRWIVSVSDLGVDMVDIYVGSDEKHFKIHKKLLCDYAEVFEKMFNSGYEESQSLIAKLHDDDEDAFDYFVGWLYSGALPLTDDDDQGDYWTPMRLYMFAEKYCLTELLDPAMDLFIDRLLADNTLLGRKDMKEIYENTRPESKLRAFAARSLRWIISEENDSWSDDELGRMLQIEDLRLDYIRLARMHGGEEVFDPLLAPPCDFHVHDKKTSCATPARFEPPL